MNQIILQAITQLTGRPDQGVNRGKGDISSSGDPAEFAVVVSECSKRQVGQLVEQGFTRVHRFLVLPSSSKPRWLLPVGDPQRTQVGMDIYTPYALVARMLKKAVEILLGAGWMGRNKDRVFIASKKALPIEALVGEVTGERQPVFALSLGTPSHFRKLTVQVMRPNGDTLGYIKLPLTEAAGQRVRHEAAVLERLWNIANLRQYVPRVLHAGPWNGSYMLFQTCGPSQPGHLEFGPAHEAFLRTLWGARQMEKPAQTIVEELSAQWGKASLLLDAEWRDLGVETLGRASRELSGLSIPCGIMHGDFAPWNTRRGNGRLFVFDWEAAEWDVPTSWDVFHFHFQVATLLKRKTNNNARADKTFSDKPIFWLYLLRTICQGLDEESPGYSGVKCRLQFLRQVLQHS
jgi:hypothetical protein